MIKHLQLIATLSVAMLIIIGLFSRAQANITGSDFQSFNPTTDGLDFVTVQSARTLPTGMLSIGGFLDYAVNTLPNALDANQNKFSVSDHIVASDLHMGVGLMPDWDLGVSMSNILSGSVDQNQLNSYIAQSGLIDLRVNTKYRIFGKKDEGLAFNFTINFPQLQHDAFYGGGTSPALDAELIWQQKLTSHIIWAVNGGMRFRNPGSPLVNAPYEPVGTEYVASTAGAYHFNKTYWNIILEFLAARPVIGSNHYVPGELTAFEGVLGTKYTGFKNFWLHAGLTAQGMHGTSSPDYRVYAGLNWFPRAWGESAAKTPQQQPLPPVAKKDQQPAPVPTPAPVEAAIMASTPELSAPPVETTSSMENTAVFDKEPVAGSETITVQGVRFRSNSAEVPPSMDGYLAKMADYLNRGRPVKKLTIIGHTDSLGSAEHNQQLSQSRAEAVKAAIVKSSGISPEKVDTVGMGSSAPVTGNETAEGRALNRRVEFRIERE